MSLNLDENLQLFLNQKIASGAFRSESEVLISALRLMQEQESFNSEEFDELRALIQIGVDENDRGEGAPFVPGQAQEEGRRLLAQFKQKTA